MSSKVGGEQGGEGRGVFLSAHRCPEVDLLPHCNADTQIHLPCSILPAETSHFTCTSVSEANYLDISATCGEDEEEEEEGGVSDWSEEDLSFHFSPSVILPSEDEDSGPESGFECVDVTVETQVNGQEGEGPKMVPKRQIHLKKKKDVDSVIDQKTTDELEVTLKDQHVEGEGPNCDVSTRQCPHLLLRQHSTPISLTASSDVISSGVYRGLIAGANQGFQTGPHEGQRRLQKSFSLDETKTKMASCIIKSVLLKKMQVEQRNSHLKKDPQVLPVSSPPAEQQSGRQWGIAGRVVPVPVVRDVRSLVKNTCSLSLPKASTPKNHKVTSFSVAGQEGRLPPTHQHILSQTHDRQQKDTSSHPVTWHRRGSEPITGEVKDDDAVLLDLPTTAPVRQSDMSHLLRWPNPPTSRLPQRTQALLSAQEQSSITEVSSHSAPGSAQVLHPCFYAPHTLHPHLDNFSSVHSPLSSIQTQVHSTQLSPMPHLHTRSENQNRCTGKSSDQIIKTCPSHRIRTTGVQEGHGGTVTTATQQQHQQPFLCRVQVRSSFLSGSHGALLSGTAPCHVTVDPKSRQCLYVNPPPQFHSKTLVDPETGQFIQVFIPAANATLCRANSAPTITTPSPTVVQVGSANPAPAVLHVNGAHPPVMSVMQLQPTVAVSSLYAPPHLPFTLHMPSVYTAP